jgi:FMN reductase [NAD(P)H]
MPFSDIIKTRRTIRLYQQKSIPYKDLEDCVDCARLAPSARNSQPLEYVIVDSQELLKDMFSCMGFGGGISSFVGKEPVAYIVILVNKDLKGPWAAYDSGLAVENLCLAAWEKGIGTCILARINREKIKALLKIPDKYEIDLVITMGYPAEKSAAEEMKDSNNGYRDEKGVWHVPKRPLKKIAHRNGF